jgi:hypothetical protein
MLSVRGINRTIGGGVKEPRNRWGGKKTAEVAVEQDKEVKLIFTRAIKAEKFDLEAVEAALRAAVLTSGAKALETVLACVGRGRRSQPMLCVCGAHMKSKGLKRKEVLTILGKVVFRRSMYKCPVCGKKRHPADEDMDIEGTTRSPAVRRMMARAGSKQTFKEGSEDLRIYAGIKVSPKDVERVAENIGKEVEQWLLREKEELMKQSEQLGQPKKIPTLYISYDGTGVPMIPKEVKGRKGKQPDGSAKTREAKIGCVFTQTFADKKGFPLRDEDSTTYFGAIEGAEHFGDRLYAEAVRRGLLEAQKVVVLGDGARWIKGLAEMHFSMATHIVDLYHAREHISNLCRILFGSNENLLTEHRIRWWTDLDEGNVEKIIIEATSKLRHSKEPSHKAEKEINYFETNKERMRYAQFRRQGFFVGSGVVEAACGTVIGKRLKQSGMEWSLAGANAIIALRCLILSGRMEEFWESRCA